MCMKELRAFDVKYRYKSTSAEFAWRGMHVRDEERSRVYRVSSCSAECPIGKKKFGKCATSVRGSDNARCHEKGYRAKQPAYDIDQSVSLDELRASLNINYYCLFDTFQRLCRKHYVCHDNHDNPGLFRPPAVVSFAHLCWK